MVDVISISDPVIAAHLIVLPIFSVLAISGVGFRFWSRNIQGISIQSNDYSIALGLVGNALHGDW